MKITASLYHHPKKPEAYLVRQIFSEIEKTVRTKYKNKSVKFPKKSHEILLSGKVNKKRIESFIEDVLEIMSKYDMEKLMRTFDKKMSMHDITFRHGERDFLIHFYLLTEDGRFNLFARPAVGDYRHLHIVE